MRYLQSLRIISFALLVGALLLVVAPQRTSAQGGPRCFPETGFCIDGRIREFWEQNGGLPVFGFPITDQHEEAVEGKAFQLQWFQRNRLELHPENARPYDVLLGLLGVDRLQQQGRDWFQFPKSAPQGGCRFFSETGHNVCGDILKAWHASGLEFDGKRGKSEAENLALFGLPLSDPQVEDTPNGRFTVQWFQRARFELHPENQPPFNVLLGLLGNEVHTMPPAPPPVPPGPPPVPEGQDAIAIPDHGPGGTFFIFGARGFKPSERVGIYITRPDQAVFGATFQEQANKDGETGATFQTRNNPQIFPAGIWAITFEGVESHHKAIAYFQIEE